MKKTIKILILVIISINSYSQIYTDFNVVGSLYRIVDNEIPSLTYGVNGSVGYTFFNEKLDLGLKFEFQRTYDQEKYNFYELNLLFKPFKWEYFKPYFGLSYSRYKFYLEDRIYSGILLKTSPEYGNTVSPIVGILFKSDLIDGFYINLGYQYRVINLPLGQNRTMNTLTFGLKYYFNFMLKEKE